MVVEPVKEGGRLCSVKYMDVEERSDEQKETFYYRKSEENYHTLLKIKQESMLDE